MMFRRKDAISTLNAFPPLEDYPEPMRAQIAALRASHRRRKVASRVIAATFYSFVVCAMILTAWFLALATDREVPTRTKVEIITPVVAAGADLDMRVSPHRLKVCEGKVIFRAYDRVGNIINQSETEWAFPVGQLGPDKTFNRKLRLSRDAVPSLFRPDGQPDADARLRIERNFFCNPVQKLLGWPIVEVSSDMTFAVGEGPR